MTAGRKSSAPNLSRRIVAWSFIPTALILLAVALVIFLAYDRATEQLVVERSGERARLAASRLANELGEYPAVLEALARTADVYESNEGEQARALRRSADSLAVFDRGVVLLDSRGTVVAAQPERPSDVKQSWADRSFFQDMLRSPAPLFSDILTDPSDDSPVVVVAVPVLGEGGELRGVLAGMFRLGATAVSSFYGDIVKLRMDEGGGSYLVDGEGRAIYVPDVLETAANLAGELPVMRLLAGQEGAVHTEAATGEGVVAGYAMVPGTDWGLVTVETWEDLAAAGGGFRQTLMFLLAMGVVIPAAVVTVGVRRMTRDSYNQLERTVADRTRELKALNAVAAVASESLEIDHVLADSLDQTLEALQLEYGAAFLIDEDTSTLNLVARRSLSAARAVSLRRLPRSVWGPAGAADGLEPRVLAVTELPEGRLRPYLVEQGVRSVVIIPLVAKGRVVGLIALGALGERSVTPEELTLLRGIGHQVGMAVDNARLYGEAERIAAAAERSRLARDLHDAVSQTLFSSALIAEVLPKIWERDPEEGRRRLAELRELTRGALAEMRTLLLELRPTALLEAELGDLLRQLAEAATGRSRIPVALEVSGACGLPPEVRVALYRVAQEALNNVVKHSEAEHAWVSLRCDPDLAVLEVGDDGRGITPGDTSSEHLGMDIME